MQTGSGWTQDLGTGVAEVDVEHQLQVSLVVELRAAVLAGRDPALVDELLRRLDDVSNVHFLSEELLMRLHSWERYESHTEEHRRLLEELRALRRVFDRGDPPVLEAALDRLQGWLTGHIRGMDRAFTEHVAAGRPA